MSIAKPGSTDANPKEGAALVHLATAGTSSLWGFRISLGKLDRVEIGRGPRAIERHVSGALSIRIPDHCMSSSHANLVRVGQKWFLRDLGSKNGSFADGAPASEAALTDGQLLELGNSFFLFSEERRERFSDTEYLDGEALARQDAATATLNLGHRKHLHQVASIAKSDLSILITGETGTGKEVLAQFIHRQSRRKGEFVALNAGAIAPHLIESELFGHVRGAFSGATQDKVGFVRAAKEGTLFLDEIAELSPSAQVSLLRVLQEKVVTPVGQTQAIAVDVRIIAATHRDLPAMVREGIFREDLYARLAGFEMPLPALRERREDLGFLINRRVQTMPSPATLDRQAMRALLRYHWPRNIRELRQTIESAAIIGSGQINAESLPAALRESPSTDQSETEEVFRRASDSGLEPRLKALLLRHRGNISAVARDLAKERAQIRRWCKHLNIDAESYRNRDANP